MTALTLNASSCQQPSINTTTTAMMKMMTSTTTNKQTLKSIKKYSSSLVGGSKDDHTNPLTLHSVDDDLFACVWSLLAELMLVEGRLESKTKESIAWMVNKKQNGIEKQNGTDTSSNGKSAKSADPFAAATYAATHGAFIQYADRLLEYEATGDGDDDFSESIDASYSTRHSYSEGTITTSRNATAIKANASLLSNLSRGGKAETGLIVLLFTHLNRVASALFDQKDLPSVMSKVSQSSNIPPAKNIMNCTTPKSVFKAMNQMVGVSSSKKPSKNKPGITSSLFPSSSSSNNGNGNSSKKVNLLPEHLQGAGYAGSELVRALARLVSWVESYQQQLLSFGSVLTSEVLEFLESNSTPIPSPSTTDDIEEWVSSMTKSSLPTQKDQIIARVLLLVSHAPELVKESKWWNQLCKITGGDTTTTQSLILWWSLKLTIQQTHGLSLSHIDPHHQQISSTTTSPRPGCHVPKPTHYRGCTV